MPNAQQELRARLLAAHGVDEAAALVTSEEEAAMRRATDQLLIKLADVAGAHKSADTIRYYAALLEAADFVFGLSVNQLDNAASGKASEPVTLGGSKEASYHATPVADSSGYIKKLTGRVAELEDEKERLEIDVATLRQTINAGVNELGFTPDTSTVPGKQEFIDLITNALNSAAASAAAPDPSKWVRVDEIGKPGTPGEPFVRVADIGRRNTPGQWFTTWQNVQDNFIARTDIGRAGTPGENLVDRTAIPRPIDPNSYVLLANLGVAGTNGEHLVDKRRIPAYVDPSSYVLKSDIGRAGTPGENLVDKTQVINPDTLKPIIEKLKGAVTHKSGLRGLVSSDSVDVPKFEEAVEGLERLLPAVPTQRTPRPGPRQP